MSAAKIVVLVLWIVAVILFGFVGFQIVETTKYSLIAIGLMCAWAGMVIFHYVP